MTNYPKRIIIGGLQRESDDGTIIPYPTTAIVRVGDKVNSKKTVFKGGIPSSNPNRQPKK